MAGIKDIRRRIKSVTNTQQITKAMKMVSAVKLRHAQDALESLRPYAVQVGDIVAHLRGGALEHPFLTVRKVEKVCYVVIGADRGLCGGYNSNLFRFAEGQMKACPAAYDVLSIGSVTQDHFSAASHAQIDAGEFDESPDFEQSAALAGKLADCYLNGIYDEVVLVYTQFKSAISQKPVSLTLLPVQEQEGGAEIPADYIFEPDGQALLDCLLPLYLETVFHRAILESKSSEHGARMTAMTAATDNATELISSLTLSLNRARQAAITTEITEIVGGAAALEDSRG